MPKPKLFPIRRELNASKAEVLIYDDPQGDGMFGGLTARALAMQLQYLQGVDELDVRINSWGGIATEGIAMMNTLARFPAEINVFIDGIAASAATIPMLAASPGKLTIAPGARIMIHEAWFPVAGNKRAMRAEADRLEILDNEISKLYAQRTGKTQKAMLKLMEVEPNGTFFTAEEAVAAGLADRLGVDAGELNVPRRGPELAWLKVPDEEPAEAAAGGEDEASIERMRQAVAIRLRMIELDCAGEE